jgi:hypothetical protein
VCPEDEIRAAPIGIVGTPGGLAGFVLPLSKCLVHRDSEDTSGYLEVEVFPPRLVLVCDGLGWNTPVGLNLSESHAHGYVVTWKFIISGCRELDTKFQLKYTNRVRNRDHLFPRKFRKRTRWGYV